MNAGMTTIHGVMRSQHRHAALVGVGVEQVFNVHNRFFVQSGERLV
jgi:hypothetical protein